MTDRGAQPPGYLGISRRETVPVFAVDAGPTVYVEANGRVAPAGAGLDRVGAAADRALRG